MALSNFSLPKWPDVAPLIDDPLIHCYASEQLILAYTSRAALMDLLRIPGDKSVPLQALDRVVERNFSAFKQTIETKFDCDEWEFCDYRGQNCLEFTVTLEDIRRSGQQFDGSGLSPDCRGLLGIPDALRIQEGP